MPNIVYNVFWKNILEGNIAWDDDTVIRALLFTTDSTYTPSRTHQTIQQIKEAGLVEVSSDTGYRRATISDKVVGTVEVGGEPYPALLGGPALFGAIESGITIKGALLFVRVGLTDQDSVDYPAVYIDTATGLPKETNGGVVVWSPGSSGYIRLMPCQ